MTKRLHEIVDKAQALAHEAKRLAIKTSMILGLGATALFGAYKGAEAYNSNHTIRDDAARANIAAYQNSTKQMTAAEFFGVVSSNGQSDLTKLEAMNGVKLNDWQHNGHKVYGNPTHFVVKGADLTYDHEQPITLTANPDVVAGYQHVYKLTNPADTSQFVYIYGEEGSEQLSADQLKTMAANGVDMGVNVLPVLDRNGVSEQKDGFSVVRLELGFSETPRQPQDTVLPGPIPLPDLPDMHIPLPWN